VTHEQLGASFLALGSVIFGGFFAFWLKLTDFAKDVGELKGTLNEFIRNQNSKKHK